MAKFQITGPDGGTYEVEAPDDASEKDILGYVQKEVDTTEAKRRVSEMSLPRKAFFGAEQALNNQGAGMVQIFKKALGGDLSPEQKRELAIRRQMVKEIPGSWSSELLGSVATSAVP